ncbi:uncharacterized protein LOC111805999 isoform X1 [Cucurbita pepo subsp. pepo]|uniref:uncharacterized protein LOC111805999 isoform X1 n=1 Tax=Cucurbita pepo subsp. pepo TaxID=3664 RepID=UPI000C9D7023|nr:uncharacterized protein LOC111805999 isoform X1 [Cucurbita pepo subsp. pepo]
MELEVSGSESDFDDNNKRKNLEGSTGDRIRVKKKTLQAVLEQCQRSLESLNDSSGVDENEGDEYEDERQGEVSGSVRGDREADELCDLLKSKVECRDFLEKLEDARASVPLNTFEECSSWDVVSDVDLWESGDALDQEGYIVVKQEDIVDGIACFMAAYLLSLKETKELSPNQLQNALCKTFSVKKRKGKLRKAWDGSKVIYNVASWGATAVGLYQNPVILSAASKAFWTSCQVISKLL